MADLYDYQLPRNLLSHIEYIADDAVRMAADATARLLGAPLEINAVRARGVSASEVAEQVGDPEAVAVGVYVAVEGSAPGHAAFVCPEEEALRLVDLLTGQDPGTTRRLDEFGLSAMQELGNILTSSYLTALSEHTGLTFLPSPPQVAIDMAYSLISSFVVGSVQGALDAISILTHFGSESGVLKGQFLYIPESAGLEVLVQHLREAA